MDKINGRSIKYNVGLAACRLSFSTQPVVATHLLKKYIWTVMLIMYIGN
jgi:hypothetical protein